MRFSENYTALVGALLEARLKYGAVLKQKSNTHFGGKYADLAAVMEAVDDALATVGIYPMQAVVKIDGEPLQLETRLMHTSGEYVVSHYPLSIKDGNPQAVGSAVTYARRYSLMALLGIAPEDDDAESAVGRGQAQSRQQARKPDQRADAPAQGRQEAPKSTSAKAAPSRLHTLARESGLSVAAVAHYLCARPDGSTAEPTESAAAAWCDGQSDKAWAVLMGGGRKSDGTAFVGMPDVLKARAAAYADEMWADMGPKRTAAAAAARARCHLEGTPDAWPLHARQGVALAVLGVEG